LKEKFEDMHLNKPTSIDLSFRVVKRRQSAKNLKKIKDQFVGPLSVKWDEEDVKQEESPPNPENL
jgi:hypothetical protein